MFLKLIYGFSFTNLSWNCQNPYLAPPYQILIFFYKCIINASSTVLSLFKIPWLSYALFILSAVNILFQLGFIWQPIKHKVFSFLHFRGGIKSSVSRKKKNLRYRLSILFFFFFWFGKLKWQLDVAHENNNHLGFFQLQSRDNSVSLFFSSFSY